MSLSASSAGVGNGDAKAVLAKAAAARAISENFILIASGDSSKKWEAGVASLGVFEGIGEVLDE